MLSLAEIGSQLVALRKQRPMTQEALAQRLGVKRQQVQRWEASAYRTASLERVSRVAEALEWSAPSESQSLGAAEAPALYTPAASLPPTSAVSPVRDLGEVVSRIRAHADELHTSFGVTRIAVFGSFARGEQTRDSDVDLIVEVLEPSTHTVFGAQEALESVLGRKVESGALSTLRPRVRPYVERELVDVWRA